MAAIVLVGFMGSGKSAVGRRVAERSGRPFVDTDRLVEEAEGMPVAEIFARRGEAAFRAAERAAVVRACGVGRAVIAAGGGAVLDAENVARLRAAGTVVWLVVEPEEVARRLPSGDERPLLQGADRVERIRTLLAAREGAYAGAADLRLETSRLGVEEAAERVLDLVAKARGRQDAGRGARGGAAGD